MSPIEHIFLYLLLFFVTFLCSFKIRGNLSSRDFWRILIVPIVLFSVIEGCRYGRGTDYLSYKYRYEHIDLLEETQAGFVFIMQVLKGIGCNYVLAFISYTLIFSFGLVWFIKSNFALKESKWMLLFALLALQPKFENQVRQFLAFPFMLVSFTYFFKRQWVKTALFFIITMSIHTGLFFSYMCFLPLYIWKNKIINFKLAILLLAVSYFIVPKGMLADFVSNLLGGVDISFLGNDSLTHYTEDSDRWLGEDSYLKNAEQTVFTMTLQFMFECASVYVSYMALSVRKNEKVLLFYNMMIIGFISCRLCFGYEILYRLTEQMRFFWFIPIGYSLGVSLCQGKNNKAFILAKYVVILYNVMLFSRFIFLYPEAKFFWMV